MPSDSNALVSNHPPIAIFYQSRLRGKRASNRSFGSRRQCTPCRLLSPPLLTRSQCRDWAHTSNQSVYRQVFPMLMSLLINTVKIKSISACQPIIWTGQDQSPAGRRHARIPWAIRQCRGEIVPQFHVWRQHFTRLPAIRIATRANDHSILVNGAGGPVAMVPV